MTTTSTPSVLVLGTGGTIHSWGNGPLDYHNYGSSGNDKLTVPHLMGWLPGVHDLPALRSEQMFQMGSPSIGPAEWLELARRINTVFSESAETMGIVVTHGTSTLEETAFFLHLTVKSDRPVVLTGSMRPPSAIGSDAPANFINDIRVAAAADSRGMGVVTILNDEIQSARDVRKGNTYRTDTFHSGEFGILGYADADHEVVYYRKPFRAHTAATEFDPAAIDALPKVAIVYAYSGDDGSQVKAAVDGLNQCERCGQPTTGEVCAFCRIVDTSRAHDPVPVEVLLRRGRSR